MSAGVIRSSYEINCVNSAWVGFFNSWNSGIGKTDDGLLRGVQHTANLVALLCPETKMRFEPIADHAAAGRATLSAFRVVLLVVADIITLRFLWQTNSKGWRRVREDETTGKPHEIPRAHLEHYWRKGADGVYVNAEGDKSTDGLYIEDDTGVFILRSWEDIAMDLGVLAARIISPFRWAHNLKVFDLGEKHAKRLGNAVMVCWAGVLALNLVVAVKNLVEEFDKDKVPERIWDAVQAFLDFAALPFDFGVGEKVRPLAIVGAAINIAAAVSLIAKSAVFYDKR